MVEPPSISNDRQRLLRQGLWLVLAVLAWNVVEGFVAVGAGLVASSVALVSFGFDSGIEVLSSLVVARRLYLEMHGAGGKRAEVLERRASRLTGGLLFVLAAYIVVDSGRHLSGYGAEAQQSLLGIVLTALSLVTMPLLGWAKLRTAASLGSGALRADAYETITCAWLSLTTLAGLVANAALGWSWADPVAALAILPLVLHEAREAWRGCGCHVE